MRQISPGYQSLTSPYAYELADTVQRKRFLLSSEEDAFLYDDEIKKPKNKESNLRIFFKKQFLGVMQPFVEITVGIKKDIHNLTERYKSPYQVKQDLMQPFFAVGKVAKGGFYCTVVIPCVVISATTHAIYDTFIDKFSFEKNIAAPSILAVSWLLHAVADTVHGVYQLATSPLKWVGILSRGAITAAYGWQPIEENKGIKRLVKKLYEIEAESTKEEETMQEVNIKKILFAKIDKASQRGQPTHMDNIRSLKDHVQLITVQTLATQPYQSSQRLFAHHKPMANNSPSLPSHEEIISTSSPSSPLSPCS